MESELLKCLLLVGVAVITGLGGLACIYINLLKVKVQQEINKLQNEEDRVSATKIVDESTDAIETAVKDANQLFVDDLKSESSDGKLTKEDAVNVFNYTLSQAKLLMGSDLYSKLEKLKPDIDSWITAKIESIVKENKTTILAQTLTSCQTKVDVTKLVPTSHPINVNSVATEISDELHKELMKNFPSS